MELLVGFYGNQQQGRLGGHYLTLTGLLWGDDDDNAIESGEATLTFIDPATGSPDTQSLFDLNTFLATAYGVGGTIGGNTILATYIEAAVSESPVPEPGTIALVAGGAGAGGLVVWRRRRQARAEGQVSQTQPLPPVVG